MARGNRQILINPHSSTLNNVPAGKLYIGEIAVEHNNVVDAALYVETDGTSESASTVAKFISSAKTVALIDSAYTALGDRIDAINNAVGLPHTDVTGGTHHWDENDKVWDAIEEVYESLVASAAAATTTVEKADSSEDWLSVDGTYDPTTEARRYTIAVNGIGEAISGLSANVITYVNEVSGNIETVINTLSGDVVEYVKAVSGNIETVINNFSAGTMQLSADTYNTISGLSAVVETLSAATAGALDALDFSGVTPNAGQAIVNVTQNDGKVSAELGDIAAEHVTVADTAGKLTADNVEDALSEIVDMVEGATDLKITAVTPSSTNVKEEYALVDSAGTALGDHIKIYKDSAYKEIYLGTSADTIDATTGVITKEEGDKQSLNYAYMKDDGSYDLVKVDVSAFLSESEFKSGVTATNHIVHGVVDPQSETFLTVGADGFKLSGVQDAIDAAKASATTKVVEGTDAGNNMTIVPTTGADGSVTYTVNLTDVASKTGLDNEISARTDADTAIQNELDAVEEAVGLAADGSYIVKTGTTYLDTATTVEEEISALDTALNAVSEKVTAMSVVEGTSTEDWVSLTVESATSTGQTAITINDSLLNTELLRLSGAVDTERDARVAADDTLLGTETASTSADTSIWGVKKLVEQLTEDLNDKAVQNAEFEVLTDAERDEDHCNAGIKVVDNDDNGKKIQLDLSLLKIDCGVY